MDEEQLVRFVSVYMLAPLLFAAATRSMMSETRIAKLFKNGASQAVRLPSNFQFAGDEVHVTRDDATGDVVLSNRPGARTWSEFFELLHEVDVPVDFMSERLLNVLPQERGIFDDQLSADSKPAR